MNKKNLKIKVVFENYNAIIEDGKIIKATDFKFIDPK